MTIPENTILQILEYAKELIVKDYEEHKGDEKKSLLYGLFGKDNVKRSLVYEKYDWFEQAKHVFLRKGQRQLDIKYGFNSEKVRYPVVHIMLPSEESSEQNIDFDRGVQWVEEGESYVFLNTYYFRSTYNLLIASDNMNEVLLIYSFVKIMLVMLYDQLELNGMRDVKISGQDIQMDNSLIPDHVYTRNVNLSFFYEQEIRNTLSKDVLRGVFFEGNQ
jgi:hypothetical protein